MAIGGVLCKTVIALVVVLNQSVVEFDARERLTAESKKSMPGPLGKGNRAKGEILLLAVCRGGEKNYLGRWCGERRLH